MRLAAPSSQPLHPTCTGWCVPRWTRARKVWTFPVLGRRLSGALGFQGDSDFAPHRDVALQKTHQAHVQKAHLEKHQEGDGGPDACVEGKPKRPGEVQPEAQL